MKKVKKPSMKLRRQMAPLITACRTAVITSPSRTRGEKNWDTYVYIAVKWPTKKSISGVMVPDMPEDFPTGSYLERSDSCVKVRHNVVSVLLWLKAKGYIDYDASDLYAARLPEMMRIAQMETQLNKVLDVAQEYVIE